MVEVHKDIFAANLNRLMRRFRYTNAALGRHLGVSRQMMRNYRHGETVPTEATLLSLMQIFKCTRSDLIDIDKDIFAANLDRLMTRSGYSNAALGRNLGVSRQMIWNYRHGGTVPTEEKLTLLVQIFKCPRSEFILVHPADPMLSLPRWAKREAIPYARAVDLFKLGILEGAVITPHQVFIPPDIHAPAQSKRLVLLAKRRPKWVEAFTSNFGAYMVLYNIENHEVAKSLGVSVGAVAKWRSGVSYPTVSKLPLIAKLLGCSYDDLMSRSSLGYRDAEKIEQVAA